MGLKRKISGAENEGYAAGLVKKESVGSCKEWVQRQQGKGSVRNRW